MNVFVCYSVLLLAAFASAASVASKDSNSQDAVKNKRELPAGPYSGGVSHKYLPPSIGSGGGGYSSGSSYDFGHGGGGYSGGAGSDIGHGNVETYIIQSSGNKGPSFGGSSFGGSSLSGSGAGGYKYPNAGLGVTLGHKVVVPSQSYGSPSLSFGSAGSSFSGGHGSSYSGGHSPSITYGTPSVSYLPPSVGFSSGLGSGSHYHGSNGFSGSSSSHGSNSLSFSGSSSSHGGNALSFVGPSSHGGSSFGSGSYNIPSKHSSIPSSVYGAPQITSFSPKYSGSSFGLIGGGSSSPNYAIGHKGLGHFAYSPSKPAALNTDFVSSSSFSGGFGGGHGKAPFKPSAFLGSSQDSGSSYPSNQYLPPSHEYLPPSHSSSVSQEYLPPSHSSSSSTIGGGGSSYHVPSTVYGAPSGSGASHSIYEQVAPIHESSSYSGNDDSSYVTPEQSYAVPSAPGKSYLPPSTSYGTPSTSYGTPSHH